MKLIERRSGVETFLLHDDSTNTMVERQTQDVEAILDNNKRLANDGDGYSESRDLRRLASIPTVVFLEMQRQGITNDQAAIRRWLNDPDNRFFRTSPGRV